jgi:hypothetical protein
VNGNLTAQKIAAAARVTHRNTVGGMKKGGEASPALFLMLPGIAQFPISKL